MPRDRKAFRAFVITLLSALLVAGAVTAPPPAQAATCADIFDADFRSALAARYPGMRITAAVYDTRTGCWHHLNNGMSITTASVIKAQIMGAVLLRAQDAGRELTSWERSQIAPMIRYSHNPETSALYRSIGLSGMEASDQRFGAQATSYSAAFGVTRTTARDRTMVSLRLLHAGGPLSQDRVDEAWSYMSTVHPLQQWGITAGVPDGWTVALKNGFYPSTGLGWRIGSTGFVRSEQGHEGYAITVLTEQGPNMPTGIKAVEQVAARAAAQLTVGPQAARPIDRARCVTLRAGQTWPGAAGQLGLPISSAGQVQSLAGGNNTIVAGQQACSPVIPAEPVSPASTVNGRYRPVVSDLTCDRRDDLLWYGVGAVADSLWVGSASRRFSNRSINVAGDYYPVSGDFDGDGCGDVLWYGPGARPDSVWFGGGSITSKSVSMPATGLHPMAGDFDADGRDDVLWYGPAGAPDSVWSGAADRTFTAQSISLSVPDGVPYSPTVGDFDADSAADRADEGADDVLWYTPGPAPDPLWRGSSGQRGVFVQASSAISGRYRVVSADLDGATPLRDEIVWHGPGATPDSRWHGLPPQQVVPFSVGGSYLPLAGDFDGDARADLAWYGPGGGGESVWWSGAGGTPTSGPLRALI